MVNLQDVKNDVRRTVAFKSHCDFKSRVPVNCWKKRQQKPRYVRFTTSRAAGSADRDLIVYHTGRESPTIAMQHFLFSQLPKFVAERFGWLPIDAHTAPQCVVEHIPEGESLVDVAGLHGAQFLFRKDFRSQRNQGLE